MIIIDRNNYYRKQKRKQNQRRHIRVITKKKAEIKIKTDNIIQIKIIKNVVV